MSGCGWRIAWSAYRSSIGCRPVYGWRTVIYCDAYGRRIETREWGEISPGHFETRWREVVIGGHYETRERRVLVSAGHWERIGPPPPVIWDPPVVIQPSPRTVGGGGVSDEGVGGGQGEVFAVV